MKRTVTSFDIAAIVLELKKRLEGARIQNIYQIKGKTLLLKLHQPNQPPLNLLVESGKRLHLTSYTLEKPQKPPAFCMALRKHLRNGTICEISQHKFERIAVVKAGRRKGEFKLVFELFGEGNIILVDQQGIIQQAFMSKRMRDRDVLRGKTFHYPPPSGENPLCLESSDLAELRKFKRLEVVKALTRFLSIGGVYAEEILLRAQVDKNKRCELLESRDLEKVFAALKEILAYLEAGKPKPCIIMDEKGTWIDVVPVPLMKYSGLKHKKFENFNEASDEYFAKIFVGQEVTAAAEEVEREIARQKRILHEQQQSVEKTKQKAERMRKIGDKIYAHFHQLQMFLQRIMEEKKRGKTWQTIISEIEAEKREKKAPSVHFKSLDTKKLLIDLSIEDLSFSLRLRHSVQENASTYYDRAKKAEKKVEGAQKAIEKTKNRIKKLTLRKEIAIEETEKPIRKTRKKAWYEKFRWFHTSENLLVVGGKDAVTNEILIKKHMEPHDLVFHADIAGAPFVLIKTGRKTPSQQSINEAAQLAASHSRAWKAKFSAIDVYWVRPQQVSKTPPSGEYLRKGAFMIRGKKNYVRRAPLRLAVGVDIKADLPAVVGGPKDAVKDKTDIYVEIAPGDLPSSKLAKKIRQMLRQKVPKGKRDSVSKIPIEEIQAFIPSGRGKITDQHQSIGTG